MLDSAKVFSEIHFDDAVLYLAKRAMAEAEAMSAVDPIEAALRLRRVGAYAHAMALLPARSMCAIDAKREIADWSRDCGVYRLGLAGDIVDALIDSAEKDMGLRSSGRCATIT